MDRGVVEHAEGCSATAIMLAFIILLEEQIIVFLL